MNGKLLSYFLSGDLCLPGGGGVSEKKKITIFMKLFGTRKFKVDIVVIFYKRI